MKINSLAEQKENKQEDSILPLEKYLRMLMKKDCQNNGQSYYTNSVDPLKKKKKKPRNKRPQAKDIKSIKVKFNPRKSREHLTMKALCFSGIININSAGERVSGSPTYSYSTFYSNPCQTRLGGWATNSQSKHRGVGHS